MAKDGKLSRQYPPWQFSLAGLLSFVLASAIYFGVVSVSFGSPRALGDVTGERVFVDMGRDFPSRLIATIVLGWGGLLALYCSWRLKAALVIHFSGPVAFGVLALVALALSLPVYTIKVSVQISLYLLLYGPFISVLFGFPVAVLMLIYRVL